MDATFCRLMAEYSPVRRVSKTSPAAPTPIVTVVNLSESMLRSFCRALTRIT
jgi:hypothetical protein